MIKIELTDEEFDKLLHCVAMSISHCEDQIKDCERLKAKNKTTELDVVILSWKNRISERRPLLEKLYKC